MHDEDTQVHAQVPGSSPPEVVCGRTWHKAQVTEDESLVTCSKCKGS
jgi:hypothetical protein